MRKYGVLGLLLLMGISFPVQALEDEASKAEALPITLKENVEVSTRYVKLGDLFENVGADADKQVFLAPKAGRQITLGAQELLRIAKNNQLDWQPLGTADFIKITRLAQEVSMAEIESLVMAALAEEGVPTDSEISFANKKISLFVPVGEDAEVSLASFTYNSRNGQFVASAVAGGDDTSPVRISGRVFPTVMIPVLTKDVDAGQIIMGDDIALKSVRKDAVRARAIYALADAVGKEAKRSLRTGDFVTKDDLVERHDVEKGKLITVMFILKNMKLAAQAKALESGSIGDTIKVINPDTKQVFSVTVTGINVAAVEKDKI